MADTVELKLNVVAETAMAYGITEDDPDDPVIWLPKSKVEALDKAEVGSVCRFDVPEWLATDKGLV